MAYGRLDLMFRPYQNMLINIDITHQNQTRSKDLKWLRKSLIKVSATINFDLWFIVVLEVGLKHRSGITLLNLAIPT